MCVNQPTLLLYMILLTNQPTLLLYMILLTNQPTLLYSADHVLTFVLLSWVQWVGQAGGGVARSWHRPWWASCTPARHVASCSSHRFLNINRGSGSGLLQLTEVSKHKQRSGSGLLQLRQVPKQEQRSGSGLLQLTEVPEQELRSGSGSNS